MNVVIATYSDPKEVHVFGPFEDVVAAREWIDGMAEYRDPKTMKWVKSAQCQIKQLLHPNRVKI